MESFEYPMSHETEPSSITHSEILTVWKTAIETQKHFAELSIKMRQVGLTLTGAILAVAIILLRDETLSSLAIFGISFPLVSLVFFTAAGVLQAANLLDTHVYHKMLRGAVKFNEIFEDENAEKLFGTVGMTQTISAYSRAKDKPVLGDDKKSWSYDSPRYAGNKISYFYHIPSLLLGILALAFIWSANVDESGVEASSCEQEVQQNTLQ